MRDKENLLQISKRRYLCLGRVNSSSCDLLYFLIRIQNCLCYRVIQCVCRKWRENKQMVRTKMLLSGPLFETGQVEFQSQESADQMEQL